METQVPVYGTPAFLNSYPVMGQTGSDVVKVVSAIKIWFVTVEETGTITRQGLEKAELPSRVEQSTQTMTSNKDDVIEVPLPPVVKNWTVNPVSEQQTPPYLTFPETSIVAQVPV